MNDPARRKALRSFLQECRARIKPEEVGLPSLGRRRVAGLRREEVAQLAGVSVSWYTLFETARDIRVSSRMLDNVARALRLSSDEKLYLFSLAIEELPTLPRADIVGAGSVGIEYAELMLFAKKAQAASSLQELEDLATEFLFRLSSPTEIAYFVHADLNAREFWFTSQRVADEANLVDPGRRPFAAVDDSEPVLVRGEVFAEHGLERSPHELMRERANALGTGRFISAGIKAKDLTAAIGYAQPSREPHSDREKYLLGLVAELVTLALIARR
jgi:transcriptional regulator with XRE-family HTH domain